MEYLPSFTYSDLPFQLLLAVHLTTAHPCQSIMCACSDHLDQHLAIDYLMDYNITINTTEIIKKMKILRKFFFF